MSDFHDLLEAERAMSKAVSTLDGLKQSAAVSQQVVDFAGDRAKSELAKLVVEFLAKDMSATAAEWHGRADGRYTAALSAIGKQTADAQAVLNKWKVAMVQYESARSILAARRTTAGIM